MSQLGSLGMVTLEVPRRRGAEARGAKASWIAALDALRHPKAGISSGRFLASLGMTRFGGGVDCDSRESQKPRPLSHKPRKKDGAPADDVVPDDVGLRLLIWPTTNG
jgi:hypothetical protein